MVEARATGKTTRAVLEILLEASRNPGTPVQIIEYENRFQHFERSLHCQMILANRVKHLTRCMPNPREWKVDRIDRKFWLTFGKAPDA